MSPVFPNSKDSAFTFGFVCALQGVALTRIAQKAVIKDFIIAI